MAREQMLRAGHVPTERIAPVLALLIRERWPQGGGLEVLSEKVGCDWGTIAGIIDQENPGVSFDLADRLICALGRWDMWHGELADIYPEKFVQTCALPSCGKQFPEYHRGGKHPKWYCSMRCRRLGDAMERAGRPGLRLRQRGRCLRGHRMSGDNVITRRRQDGSEMRQCRICRAESDRLYKRRKRAKAAA